MKFRRILEVLCLQGLQKSSRRIFLIYVSINKDVCCEVQTHFMRSLFAKFTTKVLGAFSGNLHPKTKLFAVKFRRILDLFTLQGL